MACSYIAPLKALVAERMKDWRVKFGGLGKKVGTVTRDALAVEYCSWHRLWSSLVT